VDDDPRVRPHALHHALERLSGTSGGSKHTIQSSARLRLATPRRSLGEGQRRRLGRRQAILRSRAGTMGHLTTPIPPARRHASEAAAARTRTWDTRKICPALASASRACDSGLNSADVKGCASHAPSIATSVPASNRALMEGQADEGQPAAGVSSDSAERRSAGNACPTAKLPESAARTPETGEKRPAFGVPPSLQLSCEHGPLQA
jgi:hypothetical protein